MKTLLITSTIAGLLTFTNISLASPGYGKNGSSKYSQMTEAEKAEHMQKRLDRMASKLGLTEEQKAEIQELKQTGNNDLQPLFIEKKELEKEIRELDTSVIDYADKLADAANRQAELTRQLIIAKGNQRQRINSILTPEQLEMKNEMKKNRKGKKSQ